MGSFQREPKFYTPANLEISTMANFPPRIVTRNDELIEQLTAIMRALLESDDPCESQAALSVGSAIAVLQMKDLLRGKR